MKTTILLPVAFAILAVVGGSILYGGGNLELARYRERVKILHDLINAECQVGHDAARAKRQVIEDQSELTDLRVEKLLYARMKQILIDCKKKVGGKATPTEVDKSTESTTTTTTPTTTTTAPTTTTTTPTTTTPKPLPQECINAINLTEAWRMDHKGSNIKPINGEWNCDTRDMAAKRPWFRFTGDAGNHMLNSCPPSLSCGAAGSIWSDHIVPLTAGQATAAHAYTRYGGNCKHITWDIAVMRCSETSDDVVYQFRDNKKLCHNSFCGMK